MAYEKKNTVDYFPHIVNHGRKMFIIRNQFGNDGYAVWFMLLEELGKATNHFLNLNDNTQVLYLSAEMKVSQELFIKIIETLVELDEFDAQLWSEAKVIYSVKFVESVKDAYKRRKNKLMQFSEICIQFLENGKQYYENSDTFQQTKRNDIKLNKTKEDVLINIDILKEDYLKNKRLIKAICGSQKLEENQLKKLLEEFNIQLSSKSQFMKTWDDYTSHFLNWQKKKPKNTIPSKNLSVKEKLKKYA